MYARALLISLLGILPLSPPVQAPAPAVLFLGDSLSAGRGLLPEESFPARIAERIEADGLPFRVVNAGVSGDTSAGGLRRIDWLVRQRLAVLVLELGGNDGLRGIDPETTYANLLAIVERTRAAHPDVDVVVAGMQVPPNLGADYTARFRAVFPRLAEATGATLIPFLLEGVGGRPELNLPDGIHPTAEGHRIVADTVWETLRPILERRAGDGQPSRRPSAGLWPAPTRSSTPAR